MRHLLAIWPREPLNVFEEEDDLHFHVRWVSRHAGTESNEAADAFAKGDGSSAASLGIPKTISLVSAKRWRKLQLTQQYFV